MCSCRQIRWQKDREGGTEKGARVKVVKDYRIGQEFGDVMNSLTCSLSSNENMHKSFMLSGAGAT